MNLNFDIYDRQHEFLTAAEHFLTIVAGIAAGKSKVGAMRALLASLGTIGEKRIPVPNIGVVTAPTYPMLRDASIRTFMEIACDLVVSYNKVEGVAKLFNGSEVLFRSAHHPELLRGPNLSWWWGDEAALYQPIVWDIMIGRLREGGRFGYAWMTTTPKGRNFIWRKFVQAANPAYRLIKARTSDNPFLSPDFVAALAESYVGDFARQELEGDFVAFEGLIYPEFNRDAHMTTARPPQFSQVVAGVDWGYTNPGVISVFGVDGDGRMWGLHEEYQRQRRIEEWVNVAVELRNVYGIERFFCDPSEPANIDLFNQAGCRAEKATNDVNAGIQQVKQRLVVRGDGKARLLFSPAFANTLSEFDQYQWQPLRGGGLADKPVKANDHAMDSLRYAVMGIGSSERLSRVTVDAQTYQMRMRE